MRHTASHFTKPDSCQQRVCSPDPLYAKYIQYHVWKQCCFGIQLHGLSPVSLTTSLCPHCLPCSGTGWLLSWTVLSLLLLGFFFLFVPYFSCFCPFPFLCLSLSPYPLCPLVSLLHPPHVDNSPSVCRLARDNGLSLRITPITRDNIEGRHTDYTVHTVSPTFFFICLLLDLHIPIALYLFKR